MSAPSVTMTSPASGRPDELVARPVESAPPSRVVAAFIAEVGRSPADDPLVDENRKRRSTNFLDSASKQRPIGGQLVGRRRRCADGRHDPAI